MRRPFLGFAAALAIVTLAPADRAHAQFTGAGGDPFSLYYGYYLPHQAYIAAQPTPLDTINQVTAARQYTAQTDRAALYDPISPYGEEDLDPLRPYSDRRGRERTPRVQGFSYGGNDPSSNTRGTGPALYYNRTARYFPTLRTGRGPNRNIAAMRAPQRGGMGMGGGMGMPSMTPSMTPGPR
jgi:hypothetical protein